MPMNFASRSGSDIYEPVSSGLEAQLVMTGATTSSLSSCLDHYIGQAQVIEGTPVGAHQAVQVALKGLAGSAKVWERIPRPFPLPTSKEEESMFFRAPVAAPISRAWTPRSRLRAGSTRLT
eukprot:6204847-Pyramimonas_sp.AAC.1